ncbi:unnamed protein product [Euphydryas editha]|uniref:Core-binding (CB) domain-containing protein n=1 Tax=Euphydryas editha TaxID=104508 RepID=A0AAU9VC07_EUPED|nr:unnamed protein product [Euphydryas editha]
METNRCTRLHNKNNIGISHSLPDEAASSYTQYISKRASNVSFNRYEQGYRKDEVGGGIDDGSTVSKLFVSNVLSTKGRRKCQTHIQSESLKSICSCFKIPTNQYAENTPIHTTIRLDGQNRHKPGVLSPAYCSIAQTVSTAPLPTRTAANELPALRAKFGTKSVRVGDKLGRSNSEKSRRHPSDSVFRRFSDRQSKSPCSKESCYVHSQSIRTSGLENKLYKIHSDTQPDNGIPRCNMEFPAKHQITIHKEMHEDRRNDNPSQNKAKNRSKRSTKLSGNVELRKFCCSSRETELSSAPTNLHQSCEQEFEGRTITQVCSNGTALVASLSQRPISNPHASPYPLYGHRCIRSCMGCTCRQSISIGKLVNLRKESSLQSKGITCNTKSFTKARSEPPLQFATFAVRQPDCSIIFTERRGNEVSSIAQPYLPNSGFTRLIQNTSNSPSYPRRLQRGSRSLVSPKRNSGVALALPSNHSDFCQMGNPGDRSVRLSKRLCSAQVLHPRLSRQSSSIPRRVLSDVGLSTSMGISASIFNAQDSIAPEQVQRHISNNSPEVAEGVLEARPKEQSSSTSMDHQESTSGPDRHIDRPSPTKSVGNDSGSLEMWGWSEFLSEWTEQQKGLLLNSWRTSSLRTYKLAWERWIIWANQNNVSQNKPDGSQLARFLADLHQKDGYSYNTILTYKSAVSTLCDPQSSERLSGHPLVKRMLKSIALTNPKISKAPIWDVDPLVEHISKINPDINNLYQISKYTASILLLCSGRRVHDLTLLRVNENCCSITPNHITLWSVFGSKTDSAEVRQSGWKLSRNTVNKSLDPVHWINLLITAGFDRRKLANCENLFITTCGPAKAASRSVIGGWVKNMLKESGINASAGSFRAAVASKSWIENSPLDEILSRGNWKSVNTFKRFYCREVTRCKTKKNKSITQLFPPVD